MQVQALFHRTEGRLQAVAFDGLKPEWKAVDPALAADFATLARAHRGNLEILSRTASDSLWVVAFNPDDGPTAYYLYERPR